MLLRIKNSKRVMIGIFAALTLLVVSSLAFMSLNAQAAEFETGDVVTIDSVRENLYVAGSQIDVESNVRKDLNAAGSLITIEGNVQRNINAAAGQIVLDADAVDGTVRLAGGEVTIRGTTIEEDLFVFSGRVTLEDVTLAGDLIISSGEVSLTNTEIRGDAYVSYGEYSGDDLDASVAGTLEINETESPNVEVETNFVDSAWFVFGYALRGEFAVIIATLVLVWLLGRRNRLAISTIDFNKTMAIDFLIGILVLVVPIILFIISAIVAIFPFVGILSLFPAVATATGLIYLYAIFSSLFIVVYLSNLYRNASKSTASIRTVTLITLVVWIVLEILSLIPILGWLISLVLALIGLANTGFLFRTLFNAVGYYLKKRDKEFVPEEA